jgi:hypothetical protein
MTYDPDQNYAAPSSQPTFTPQNFSSQSPPSLNFLPTNFSSTPNLSPSLSSSQTFTVENLELAELLKNQHVRSMYNSWKQASQQVIEGAQMQQTLWRENSKLVAEIEALKIERQGAMGSRYV